MNDLSATPAPVAASPLPGLGLEPLRRRSLGTTVYSAGVLLVPPLPPTAGWSLTSDARSMLSAVPCFIVLAALGKRPRIHALITCVFALGLVLLTQYVVRGGVII